MHESIERRNISPEDEQRLGLARIIEDYFPHDFDFLSDMEMEDMVGALYGMLLEIGEDPDEILKLNGVTE